MNILQKGRALLKNEYMFSILSKIMIILVGFFYTVLQARYLGSELKGEVAYITSITGITAIVFGIGIHQAYPYYKQKGEDIDSLRRSFVHVAVILFVAQTLVSLVIGWQFRTSETWLIITLITPLLVYTKYISYLIMVDTPNRKNRTEVLVNLIDLVVLIGLIIFTVRSIWYAILLIVLKDVMMSVVFSGMAKFDLRFRKEDFKRIPQLMAFGIMPMLALLMTTLNYRVDTIMLKGEVTNAQIGVYSVGIMLAEKVWLIPDAMREVLVSKLANGRQEEEVAMVIRVCNTVCLFIVLGIIVLGKPVISILFGAEYDGAYEVTVMILAGIIGMIYYKMISNYNIVNKKQNINLILLSISVVGNIGANYLLIPVMGIMGAALASLISYTICAVMFIVYFVKKTGIPFKKMIFITKADWELVKKKSRKKKNVS